MTRILIVEDERKTAETLELYLRAENYEVRIESDGRSGLEEALRGGYDLVLLDLMLPRMYGMDVCRRLREESRVPVIMLTARTLEDDQVRGLDVGADDYITKPFSPRQVMARIRSVLRRGHPYDHLVRMAGVVVDARSLRATIDGEPVDLTRTEARILRALMEASGRSLTREEILVRAFDDDGGEVTSRAVDSHVKNLRRKLAAARVKIVTTHGVGYRLSSDGAES